MKLIKKNYFIQLVLIILFTGCQKTPSNLTEYKLWFNEPENGFVKEKHINGLYFKALMKPVELMMVGELADNISYDPEYLDSIKKSYGLSTYFLLEIGVDPNIDGNSNSDLLFSGIKNYDEFAERVNYLSFQLENNCRLVNGEDTIAPSIYHFERGYELGKKQSFVFAFPIGKEIKADSLTFFFNDEVFYTGLNIFKFKANNSFPKLPLKLN